MNKGLIILTTFLLLFCFLNDFSYQEILAAEWCKLENDEWYCLDSDNQVMINTWENYEASWYYLSSEGTIIKNCIIDWKNASYFVDTSGKMVQNSWIYIDKSRNTIGKFEEGWYYFGEDGKSHYSKNNNLKKRLMEIHIFLMRLDEC